MTVIYGVKMYTRLGTDTLELFDSHEKAYERFKCNVEAMRKEFCKFDSKNEGLRTANPFEDYDDGSSVRWEYGADEDNADWYLFRYNELAADDGPLAYVGLAAFELNPEEDITYEIKLNPLYGIFNY